MARDLRNKRYNQMGEKYRSRNTREEFRAERKKQRKAGESGAVETFNNKGGTKNAAFGGKVNSETPGATAFKGSTTNASGVSVQKDEKVKGTGKNYNQNNPERSSANPQFKGNYDANAPKTREQLDNYDLQATGVGTNQQRLSRQDAKGLIKAGYSQEDVMDYAASLGGAEGKNKRKEGFVGKGAQNMFEKWKEKAANKIKNETPKPETTQPPTNVNPPSSQPTPTPTPTPTSTNKNDVKVKSPVDNSRSFGGHDFNNNTISGDGNTFDFSQTDNSFNVTEGNRIFSYQGGQGGSVYDDAPMSALSMEQAFNADDGSGAASGAKFLANWVGANKTIQAQLNDNRTNHGASAIKMNEANRADPDPLNQIAESPLAMKDYATQNFGKVSNMFSSFTPQSFNLSDIRKNNFDALQDKNKDDDDD